MKPRTRAGRTEGRILDDFRKYVAYALAGSSFIACFDVQPRRQQVMQVARSIRGRDLGPTIVIHGIMPRSGTVYVGELLRRHPDLHAYPNNVWEAPFLQQTDHVLRMQRDFFLTYEQNVGKIGQHDFLPLFGAAFIAYLYSFVPEGKRMLLKVPGVHHLDRFFAAFPHEHLLLLVRDGRDVVHSTRKTWPQITFGMACRRWKRSARMVLACHQRYKSDHSKPSTGSSGRCYWLARFEDAVRDPAAFVRQACQRFGLDDDAYPFGDIDRLPVRGSTTLSQQRPVDWAPVDKPRDFDPIGHWQDWSWWRKWRFKRIAGQELIALGYCEDLDW